MAGWQKTPLFPLGYTSITFFGKSVCCRMVFSYWKSTKVCVCVFKTIELFWSRTENKSLGTPKKWNEMEKEGLYCQRVTTVNVWIINPCYLMLNLWFSVLLITYRWCKVTANMTTMSCYLVTFFKLQAHLSTTQQQTAWINIVSMSF